VLSALYLCGCSEPSSEDRATDAAVSMPDSAAGDAGELVRVDAHDAAIDPDEAFEIPKLRPDLFDGPELLSQAGLYSDLPRGVLADGVREYRPLGELWSDGATKKRFISFPLTRSSTPATWTTGCFRRTRACSRSSCATANASKRA